MNTTQPATSPTMRSVSPVVEGEKLMEFPEAMKLVIDGKKVTRLEWKNEKIYFVLHDGRLRICGADGKFADLIVRDGDMMGTDYIIVK